MKCCIGIPCYNGARFLINCIESLLNQTILPNQIIILDDGSVDKSYEIGKKYEKYYNFIKLIRHESNKGVGNARNTIITHSDCDIIIFIDVDCIANEKFIEYILDNFKDNSIAGVCGQEIPVYVNGIANKYRSHNRQSWGSKRIINPEFLWGLCSAFRKEALHQVGLYDPLFRTNGEDADICYRLRKKGFKLVYDPRIKVYHMRNDNIKSLFKMTYGHAYYGSIAILKNGKKRIVSDIRIILGSIFHHLFLESLKNIKDRNYDFLLLALPLTLYRAKAVVDAKKQILSDLSP